MEILTPAPLKHGDRVAIVAPSGIINRRLFMTQSL